MPIYSTAVGQEFSVPLQTVLEHFPDSLEIEIGDRLSIGFCPDNTCEQFVAAGDITLGQLQDFVFLYLYYFSDYYVLKEWREREEPVSAATEVFSKDSYLDCDRETEVKSASCLLHRLNNKYGITFYFIRHDEGYRNVTEYDIFELVPELRSEPE